MKQIMQTAHHLRCCSYAGYSRTSQWAKSSVSRKSPE